MNADQLESAVAPNIFDAVLDPTLVFSLVLANLMSERLWALRERVLIAAEEPQGAGGTIRRIQHLIDQHFEHIIPVRVVEMNGVLDADAEGQRLGAEAVDYAIAKILSTYTWRIEHGTLEKGVLPFELIKKRKFPAYVYATIDEARATRRLLHKRKHKPLGLTCCLDEAAIFAALVLSLPPGSVEQMAFIGSPAHYTVLVWTTDETWWFYGKHDLLTAASWSQLVAKEYGGNAQAAFDDRLPNFDRIIAEAGTYTFATGDTSIGEDRLAAIVERIDLFLGFRTAQLENALRQCRHPLAPADLALTFDGIASASGAEEVRARMRRAAIEDGNSAALRALYTFRTLDLPDLRPYLRSARRSTHVDALSASVDTIDDAIAAVAAIGGDDSIFEDRNRIAMPDETIRFATGSDRDKALLLHVLLERVLARDASARTDVKTVFTESGSYVVTDRLCIDTRRMAPVPEIEGTIQGCISGDET